MPAKNGYNKEESESTLLATDVGTRIGVMYVPTSIDKAEMHFIINGEDHGACAKELPLTDPFYAVVDVYGSTKCVKIIQLKTGMY